VTAVVPTALRRDEELLTVDDVARWLNVPKRWVYDRAQRGELPAGRAGKYLRFRRADVVAYVEQMFAQD
jgi:PTS system nitrogen regulatory IIA component